MSECDGFNLNKCETIKEEQDIKNKIMTPSDWAPSASDYNNQSRQPTNFVQSNNNNYRQIGTSVGLSEYEGGNGSVGDFDKLEIQKLKGDVEHLRS